MVSTVTGLRNNRVLKVHGGGDIEEEARKGRVLGALPESVHCEVVIFTIA
jgi:hypothetical protein